MRQVPIMHIVAPRFFPAKMFILKNSITAIMIAPRPFHLLIFILLFPLSTLAQERPVSPDDGFYEKWNLNVTSREAWGWEEGPVLKDTQQVEYVTIHHGGTIFKQKDDMAAYMRNFQQWCRDDMGWMDNPYHYMIDFNGQILEGRKLAYPGDTNTEYDPTGHALICVLGNFEEQEVTDAQLESLTKLSAALATFYEVPIEKIQSHKDYTETLCPGEDLYNYLEDGTIHKMVRKWMQKQ